MDMLHIGMRDIHLRKLDLNLLVALDALLSVEEVSAAAVKMGITQSAMSHTLNRLREQFDDPLLIKGKGRMIKTAKAEALAAPLRKALLELQQAIQSEVEFVPQTSTLCFSIATNDYGDLILLPQLLALLSEQAPHIDVKVSHFDPENSTTPLETGNIEIVLCHPIKNTIGIHQEVLVEDDFCCVHAPGASGHFRRARSRNLYLAVPSAHCAARRATRSDRQGAGEARQAAAHCLEHPQSEFCADAGRQVGSDSYRAAPFHSGVANS